MHIFTMHNIQVIRHGSLLIEVVVNTTTTTSIAWSVLVSQIKLPRQFAVSHDETYSPEMPAVVRP